MKMQYIVIWQKEEYIEDTLIDAVEKAEALTFAEDIHDTALIISRCVKDNGRVVINSIRTVTWNYSDKYLKTILVF